RPGCLPLCARLRWIGLAPGTHRGGVRRLASGAGFALTGFFCHARLICGNFYTVKISLDVALHCQYPYLYDVKIWRELAMSDQMVAADTELSNRGPISFEADAPFLKIVGELP